MQVVHNKEGREEHSIGGEDMFAYSNQADDGSTKHK